MLAEPEEPEEPADLEIPAGKKELAELEIPAEKEEPAEETVELEIPEDLETVEDLDTIEELENDAPITNDTVSDDKPTVPKDDVSSDEGPGDILTPEGNSEEVDKANGNTTINDKNKIYTYSVDGIKATGHKGPLCAFTIMKDSLAVLDDKLEDTFPDCLIDKRTELIQQNILIADGDHYKFLQNAQFMNAMEATAIITGQCSSDFAGVWDAPA